MVVGSPSHSFLGNPQGKKRNLLPARVFDRAAEIAASCLSTHEALHIRGLYIYGSLYRGASMQERLSVGASISRRCQKHERGAHLCVWLAELLENNYQ